MGNFSGNFPFFCRYEQPDIALTCGSMLRECARYEQVAKIMLESVEFHNFFKYVEVSTFDIASDAFSTFKVRISMNLAQAKKSHKKRQDSADKVGVARGKKISEEKETLPFLRNCWRSTSCCAPTSWRRTTIACSRSTRGYWARTTTSRGARASNCSGNSFWTDTIFPSVTAAFHFYCMMEGYKFVVVWVWVINVLFPGDDTVYFEPREPEVDDEHAAGEVEKYSVWSLPRFQGESRFFAVWTAQSRNRFPCGSRLVIDPFNSNTWLV